MPIQLSDKSSHAENPGRQSRSDRARHPYTGGGNGFSGIPLDPTPTDVIVATVIAIYIVWRFDGSRLGFASRAVRDDPAPVLAPGGTGPS